MRRGDGEISLISECRPGNRLSISDLRGIADLTQFLRFFLSFSLSLSFSPRPLPFLCLPSREVSSRARVLANANVEEVRCVRNLDRIRISGTLINAFRDPSCSADAIIYGALTVPLSLSLSLSVCLCISLCLGRGCYLRLIAARICHRRRQLTAALSEIRARDVKLTVDF